jgi:hypothetical protein
VAQTVYALRNQELLARYRNNKKSANPNFNRQWNAVFLLLGTKRLSRHNTILCGKWIDEMADSWTEKDQLEMIDQLRERQARAWKKWEARIAEKQAAKAAGTTKGRSKKETLVLAPPAPDNDTWNMVK